MMGDALGAFLTKKKKSAILPQPIRIPHMGLQGSGYAHLPSRQNGKCTNDLPQKSRLYIGHFGGKHCRKQTLNKTVKMVCLPLCQKLCQKRCLPEKKITRQQTTHNTTKRNETKRNETTKRNDETTKRRNNETTKQRNNETTKRNETKRNETTLTH
jgi:hypothetical protein